MPDGSGKKLNNKETKKQSLKNPVSWFSCCPQEIVLQTGALA
jgi:hypothetical protein